jgi:hypothetical protein
MDTVWQIGQNKYSFEQGNPLFNDPAMASPLFKTHAPITRATKHNWYQKGKRKGSRSSLCLIANYFKFVDCLELLPNYYPATGFTVFADIGADYH